jgi:hypothetical protein
MGERERLAWTMGGSILIIYVNFLKHWEKRFTIDLPCENVWMIVERGSRQSSGRCQLGRDHLIKLGVETKLGFAQEAGCQKHMSLGCNGYGSKLLDPQNGWLINYL